MRDRCPAAAFLSYESYHSTTFRVKLDCLDISRKKEIKGIVRTSPDLFRQGEFMLGGAFGGAKCPVTGREEARFRKDTVKRKPLRE